MSTVPRQSFDALSRLTALNQGVSGQAQNLGFSYNPAGQIVQKTTSNPLYDWLPSASATRTYSNDGLNRVTQSSSYTIGYDGRGNLTSDGINTYGFSALNQLTSYQGSSSTAALTYDGLGRLVQTIGSSTGTTQFAYDGDQLLGEYDGSGNLLRRYAPGPAGADDPVAWYEGSGTANRRWLIPDERDSVIAVTDSTGALVGGTPYTYDEYGVPASGQTGRFQYTGQLWLPEVGVYHYKARVYSPTLGRFLQTDPIGYGSDMNMYAYVGGDPINLVDPSGMAGDPNNTVDPAIVNGRCDSECQERRWAAYQQELANEQVQQQIEQSFQPNTGQGQAVPQNGTPSAACNAAQMQLTKTGKELEDFGGGLQWSSLGLGAIAVLGSDGGGEALIPGAVWFNRAGAAFSTIGVGVQGYAKGGPAPAISNAVFGLAQDFLTSKLTQAALGKVLSENKYRIAENAMGKLSSALGDFKQSCGKK